MNIKIDSPCDIAQRLLDAKRLVNNLIALTACPTNTDIYLTGKVATLLLLEVQAIKAISEGNKNA